MKALISFFSICCILCLASPAQVSYNMNFHSTWTDASLPTKSGVRFNDVWGYASGGNEYAIMGSVGFTHFIDITNPASPIEIDRIAGGYTNSLWRDIKTYLNYAYSVADETGGGLGNTSGLQIFDLSGLPLSVSKVYDSNAFFTTTHNIFIDEDHGRLYAAGSNAQSNGLVVLDLSVDPANPTLMASIGLPGGYIHDVFVKNHIAYCSHGNSGLRIYDLSDPANPINLGQLTTYPNQGYNHSSWINGSGQYLVFADESHGKPLRILDVSDYSNLTIVNTFKSAMLPGYTNSIPHNPFIIGDLVYISYYHEGIQVFDISDPMNPIQFAWYDTETNHSNYGGYKGAWGCYPFLPSGNILGSDVLNGLYVTSLQNNPNLPVSLLSFSGTLGSGAVYLNWEVGRVDGHPHFVVERSTNNRDFEAIGIVDEDGRSHYQFTDLDPIPGRSVYRIKMVDSDGTTGYSQRIEIVYITQFDLGAFPNPWKQDQPLTVNISSPYDAPLTLRLMDMQGRIIWEAHENLFVGQSQIQVQALDLPLGVYWLEGLSTGQKHRVKILVH